MRFKRRLASYGLAALLFIGLFCFRFFAFDPNPIHSEQSPGRNAIFNEGVSEKKNYASNQGMGAASPQLGNTQKYEKVASVSAASQSFERDRQNVSDRINAHKAQIQAERLSGLPGRRVLSLSIGVPPDQFDGLLAAIQAVGRTTSFSVVKNDKTNEYLQLRAQRQSLEKARTQLEGLQATGGSVDERLKVQARLSEIENKIQDLGVSLGDFDAQNEFVTIRFGLSEQAAPKRATLARRTADALVWTATVYAGIGIGLLAISGALALLVHALGIVSKRRNERAPLDS